MHGSGDDGVWVALNEYVSTGEWLALGPPYHGAGRGPLASRASDRRLGRD
jgi:hypothetical protein